MTPRRLYAPAVLATLAAGGLAFLAVRRTWASTTVVADGLSTDAVSVTGTDAHPLASALALVVLASALAVLATSGRARQAVGILTTLVSLAAFWIIVRGGDALDDAVAAAVKQSPAFTGTNLPDDVHTTAWRFVAAAAFVVAMGLGALTTRFAPVWPAMGSRYDAPPISPAAQATQDDDDMWKALDEGRDPTQ